MITGARAQPRDAGTSVNRIMARIPDSLTFSAKSIADYINGNPLSQREKSLAVYLWITRNIAYNFDSIFSVSSFETPDIVSEKILKSRIGVCFQFASLFYEISNHAGIKTYVIQGYTRQQGRVDYLPHVWCASFIDSAWYLMDPTWGAGYTSNGKFVNQTNKAYFMAKPENMIKSHMPFDPLWQFLSFPVKYNAFYKGNFRNVSSWPYFNFRDTLFVYERESTLDQYISSARRMEQNGMQNAFIEAKLRVLYDKIEFVRNKEKARRYHSAVDTYNEGIRKLNKLIQCSNNRYLPERDSMEWIQMTDSVANFFTAAMATVEEIKNADEEAMETISKLTGAIHDSMRILNEQKTFLEVYLKSRKNTGLRTTDREYR